mgnify:CR=1 FL=1
MPSPWSRTALPRSCRRADACRERRNGRRGHITVRNADVRLDAVWHNRLIPFYNADVRHIAETLEKLYGVRVVVDDAIDDSHTYSGQIIHRNSIDSVLESLRNTIPVNYHKKNGKIYIVPD